MISHVSYLNRFRVRAEIIILEKNFIRDCAISQMSMMCCWFMMKFRPVWGSLENSGLTNIMLCLIYSPLERKPRFAEFWQLTELMILTPIVSMYHRALTLHGAATWLIWSASIGSWRLSKKKIWLRTQRMQEHIYKRSWLNGPTHRNISVIHVARGCSVQ